MSLGNMPQGLLQALAGKHLCIEKGNWHVHEDKLKRKSTSISMSSCHVTWQGKQVLLYLGHVPVEQVRYPMEDSSSIRLLLYMHAIYAFVSISFHQVGNGAAHAGGARMPLEAAGITECWHGTLFLSRCCNSECAILV